MKRFCLLLLSAVLLLASVACTAKPGESKQTTTTTTTPYVEPTLLDLSLGNILPQELLAQLLHAEMSEPKVKENGTQLDSFSPRTEDERPVSLKINMIERTRTHFDEMLVNYEWVESIVEVDGVGEAAYWASDYTSISPFCTLICYAEGYAIEVNLTCLDRADSTLQTQATQVALTIIAALAKK